MSEDIDFFFQEDSLDDIRSSIDMDEIPQDTEKNFKFSAKNEKFAEMKIMSATEINDKFIYSLQAILVKKFPDNPEKQ